MCCWGERYSTGWKCVGCHSDIHTFSNVLEPVNMSTFVINVHVMSNCLC